MLRQKMLGAGAPGGMPPILGAGAPGMDAPIPMIPPVTGTMSAGGGVIPPPPMVPPVQFPRLQGRIDNIQQMLASGLNRAGNPMQRPDFWQNRLGMLQSRLRSRMAPGIEMPHGMNPNMLQTG